MKPAFVTSPARPKVIARTTARVLVGFHVLALVALLPYFWTWWAVPFLLVGNAVFGSIGINLGYHRLLTHRRRDRAALAREDVHGARHL